MEKREMPKDDAGWKKFLTAEQYHILRRKGTEMPGTGKLLHNKKEGMYRCAACGNPLFDSNTKFDAHCGWPSFYGAIKGSIEFHEDNSFMTHRIEVRCARCKSHLGHIFDDGPKPTGQRYCINSLALDFEEAHNILKNTSKNAKAEE